MCVYVCIDVCIYAYTHTHTHIHRLQILSCSPPLFKILCGWFFHANLGTILLLAHFLDYKLCEGKEMIGPFSLLNLHLGFPLVL